MVSEQSIVTNVSSHQSNSLNHRAISWILGYHVFLTLPVNHLVLFFLSFSLCCFTNLTCVCSLSLACCSLKERSSWGQKGPGTWRWMTWKTMMTISSPPRNHWSTREGWAQRKGGWGGEAGEPSQAGSHELIGGWDRRGCTIDTHPKHQGWALGRRR